MVGLCTGGGCSAIACAHWLDGLLEGGELQVDAVDISPAALEVAAENVARHDLERRVSLIQSDLYDNLPEGRRYALIVSNPPYVSEREMRGLPSEYRAEPTIALRADDDGLAVVIRLLAGAAERLSPEGLLVVEVGNSATALAARFPELPFTWLDFERGGDGVFLLTAEQLAQHQSLFANEVNHRESTQSENT